MQIKEKYQHKYVAQLIKSKRELNEISQSQLSTTLGYKNGQFISNVERGICALPIKHHVGVCTFLDIEPGELKAATVADFEEQYEHKIAHS
ncbi:helix-turn-helix transcriptional regulator [Halobacteriovorax sp. GB3]|uniref:helix-turn-helix transcriptional regulator n=1 Tax=Halobacteriovorax sp. GB3 TaxID=2719615 RepID=UPI00235F919F|nr:helix-turn-helix transcriptional regulator [Halobacteriovorax sp. GB3]MDD0853021.1 helix-turn-helix transcriptional regulator [Halobacteriovorax sp. GB3]